MTAPEDQKTRGAMPGLLPCPRCGGEPRVMVGLDVWVQCTACGASSAMSATQENAIAKWNRGMME